MAVTQGRQVNGIDVDRMNEVIDDVRNDREIGRFRFRAHHDWEMGGHGRTRIQDFYGAKQENSRTEHVIEADEPDILLGTDHGANATEALLHALASCLDATLVYHAAHEGIEVRSLHLEMEGHIDLSGFLGVDPKVRPGFQKIDVTMELDADCTEEQAQQLCRTAQRYSPVFDTTSEGTQIDVRCVKR